MSLLDLAYIVVPPALALAMAGVIVVQGNRRTAALDADIAAYRARRAEAREAAAATTEQVARPVTAEAAFAERVESPDIPLVDAAAMEQFYEKVGLGKQPAAVKPDLLVTADGRTYLVQGKVGSGSTVSAAMWARTRNKRRTIKPLLPVVVGQNPARTFTPR